MSINIPFKVALYRAGKTQRQISLDARIPESRLSELVRGRSIPSSTEREALAAVLGQDYFTEPEIAVEARAR